jgi:hypothetical protein
MSERAIPRPIDIFHGWLGRSTIADGDPPLPTACSRRNTSLMKVFIGIKRALSAFGSQANQTIF